MSDRTGACIDHDGLAALALGGLSGRERADALDHLAACRTCRSHVGQVTEIVDQLLLVAPTAEPPPGFDIAVLERLPARRSRRGRRSIGGLLTIAASLIALAVIALVILIPPRTTILSSAPMVTPTGSSVGTAWIHDGEPGFVLISVPRWRAWDRIEPAPEEYRLVAVLDDDTIVALGTIRFNEPDGSWGTTTRIDIARITQIEIVDETGRTWCAATF